jgi:hypothetical protein
MLEYYFPGLDVSSLTDGEFIQRLAHLYVIRKMEADGQVEKTLSKILSK